MPNSGGPAAWTPTREETAYALAPCSGKTGGGWVGGATAVAALLGTLLGILRYFNYRTKRDRIAAVGTAFETVVDALASENDVKRLAAAIRLRRFFDPASEVGAARAAYARDALGVIAGILREQPAGNFQKILADGLSHAPSLVGADLQRTNLQGAYLGGTDVSSADCYRADLSHASLKRAVARETVFYEARLVGTVFTEADLRGANFFRADLSRARFTGARLAGANFGGSRDVPMEIAAHLEPSGLFVGPDEPLPAPAPSSASQRQIFVSRPSILSATQEAMWRLIEETLRAGDAAVVRLVRTEYPPVGVLADVRRTMADCSGVLVFGVRQLVIASGSWRPGTAEERVADGTALSTPWNQIEAGVAAALGLPVFIAREPGVVGGIFDLVGDAVTVVADLDDAVARDETTSAIERWLRDCVTG